MLLAETETEEPDNISLSSSENFVTLLPFDH